MADGIREKTTNVGGVIKRIWYAMTGATQGLELMSISSDGEFKVMGKVQNSIDSSTSAQNGVATTIFTVLDEDARYDVFVYIPGYQISQCYISAVLITSSTGAGACFVQNTTSPSTISLSVSGLNLQITQTTGSVQDVYLKIKKM